MSAKSVTVVGAGGNIGSHLVPHLARMPEIRRLVLIDRDRYEPRNTGNQDVEHRAVGRSKASVQARRALAIGPHLEVVAHAADVERLPLGLLRADLILACLDSRRPRQAVNEAAWRLGVPWIDAGVLAAGSLARVTVYEPGPDLPCLECAWSDADYRALEQAYPCDGAVDRSVAPPTGAPTELGALAAALQAVEGRKLLTGADRLRAGAELVIDAAHHRHYVTAARRNPRCLFDHAVWAIEPLSSAPRSVTVGQVLALVNGPPAERHLRVAGDWFARRLSCVDCGWARPTLRLASRLPAALRCRRCGGPLARSGHGLAAEIGMEEVGEGGLTRTLGSLGVEPGDVLTVSGAEAERHVELT
jgi:adenylyltransferase/sulfurtransferase